MMSTTLSSSRLRLVFLQKLSANSNGVLIDVLVQNCAENFASSVVKELKCEDGLVELEVPDAVAGAILGPKAKTLVEIQKNTGCKVEVHKRDFGVASPGHRRIRSFLMSLGGIF